MSTSFYYSEINLFCICVLALLWLSLPLGTRHELLGRLYRWMLAVSILFCASDMAAGILRGRTFAGAYTLIWVSNMVYMFCLVFAGYIWVLYSMAALTGRIRKRIAVPVGLLGLVLLAVTASAPLNGLVFTVDADNLYRRGPLVAAGWLYLYPCCFVPAIAGWFTKAPRGTKIAVCLYTVFPLIAGGLQAAFYGTTVTQTGIVLSVLMVYVLLQSREIAEKRFEAEKLDELLNTDDLTGLPNRRAYEPRLAALAAVPWVGAVFMDLNGLKQANDTQGHKAGDDLLRGFAQFAQRYFAREEIYRISGDEFVVLSTDARMFETRLTGLRGSVGDRACIGAADGAGRDAVQLVKTAEERMYVEKDRYYARTGRTRRI